MRKLAHARPSGRYTRALIYVFNLHTLLICCVSCVAVYLCLHFNFTFSVDMIIVALGTTFPLTFSIQQAFSRRERALQLIADLKSLAIALYWIHRDWNQETRSFPESLGDDHEPWAEQVAVVIRQLLHSIKHYLLSADGFESLAEKRVNARRRSFRKFFLGDTSLSDERYKLTAQLRDYHRRDPAHVHLSNCYCCLSKLSVMNEMLTFKAKYTRGGEGGFSRTNQYLCLITSSIEKLRVIRDYRTPTMVRYCAGLLVHVFPIILAPYFATFCTTWSKAHTWSTCPAGYTVAVLYVVLVTMLFKIQADIEMPFDMTGLDDVFLNLVAEFDEMLGEEVIGEDNYALEDDIERGPKGVCYVRTYPQTRVKVVPGEEGGPSTWVLVDPDPGSSPGGDSERFLPASPVPSCIWVEGEFARATRHWGLNKGWNSPTQEPLLE